MGYVGFAALGAYLGRDLGGGTGLALDKLIDELAKGRVMEKILRSE